MTAAQKNASQPFRKAADRVVHLIEFGQPLAERIFLYPEESALAIDAKRLAHLMLDLIASLKSAKVLVDSDDAAAADIIRQDAHGRRV